MGRHHRNQGLTQPGGALGAEVAITHLYADRDSRRNPTLQPLLYDVKNFRSDGVQLLKSRA